MNTKWWGVPASGQREGRTETLAMRNPLKALDSYGI